MLSFISCLYFIIKILSHMIVIAYFYKNLTKFYNVYKTNHAVFCKIAQIAHC